MLLPDASGDWITVESIGLYAHHGASEGEQELGQHYEVDVALAVDTRRAAQTDDLADTIDYKAVVETVVRVATEHRVRLIETVADRVAAALIDGFELAAVRVWVRKLHPPVGSPVRAVGVSVERRR